MSQNQAKYWTSIGQRLQTEAYKQAVGKEFLEAPEKQNLTDMDRRSFLKVMGAGLLFASAACYRRPVEKIIPYVNRPEEVVPGVANWYSSTCGECAASCGIVVKTREGRPIKLEGNELNPLNQGGMCARGQASILNLYDPDRLKFPVALTEGKAQEIKWADLDQKIQAALSEASQKGQKIYLLTGVVNSPSTLKLISEFSKVYPQTQQVSFDAIVPEEVSQAQKLAYGPALAPTYKMEKAKLILSFGADFLGTWISPVQFAKDFAKARRVENGSMAKLAVVESVLSLTGSNADAYLAVSSGDELWVALGLLNEILVQKKVSRYASELGLAVALAPYSLSEVSKKTGLRLEALQKLAKDLLEAEGEVLVLGSALKAKNAVALELVAALLNSILESDGKTVDYRQTSNQSKSSLVDLLALIQDMKDSKVGALIVAGVNPVYVLPPSLGFKDALKKIPLVVSLADRVDETAELAHFVSPAAHYLEAWSDAEPRKGVISIAQPVVSPLYQTRSFQDSLLTWAKLPAKSWYEFLKENWKNEIYASHVQGRSFEVFWEESLKSGVVLDENSGDDLPSRPFTVSALLEKIPAQISSAGLSLAFYPSYAVLDGRSSNNAWLQELPDPLSKLTWENALSVSVKKSSELSLKDGDVVRVKGQGFDFEVPVIVQPKLSTEMLTLAMGYGRKKAGRVGSNIGVNVAPFQKVEANSLVWTGFPVEITKTGAHSPLAQTQGHHNLEVGESSLTNEPGNELPLARKNEVIKELNYEEYRKNQGRSEEEQEGPLPSMWDSHEYKTYRWGMAIDMSACTGCNACVIGCQSENNIPTVGKDQVIRGREMQWIRIDRYYSGEIENPDVSHQPMLCQHCENAPCETVCPVLATVHSDEGLNSMVYNRCVGTRYCANNCPYKVRRFNFYDYAKKFLEKYEWKDNDYSGDFLSFGKQPKYEELVNLVLNPDITTRSRGVMEKCSFCMQRIRDSKDKAKAENRQVRDGEIKTACQQTCPSNAIVFGNTNDPHSEISKIRKNPRGYSVLEEINVKPQVTYLKKMRNV
ncbi:MAG: TAT-variant-translocated molybdopterin oxidoreductase [Deltaproteobacteria bacterium]|nr:TAT-variant-translocated molybdopterin oxidoreductase [Deltaproteobacteria bacterium]